MSLILSGTDGLSDVDGTAATPAIRGTDANTGIFFPAADTIAFAEGGAECARFDSSGNFGVGTTTVSNPNGFSKAANFVGGASGTGGYGIYLGNTLNLGIIGYFNSDMSVTNNASGAITFNINSAERMRINAGAPILCVAGGSTTATGTGIAFPATQSASSDANTLDDYEEGSWTPVINFGGAAGITTYSAQNGKYTKIGNLVTVTCYISISAKSAATGNASLVGLPFSTSTSASYQTSYIYMSANSITGAPMTFMSPGATLVNLGQTNGSTGFVDLTNTNFSNGGDFIFQTSYLAS